MAKDQDTGMSFAARESSGRRNVHTHIHIHTFTYIHRHSLRLILSPELSASLQELDSRFVRESDLWLLSLVAVPALPNLLFRLDI